MTKKWCVVMLVVAFVFLGSTMMTAETTGKEVPKQIQKALKEADSALNDKKFDKAIEKYNEILASEPEFAPAFFGLGKANLGLLKNDEAIANFEKGLALSPDSLDVKKFYLQALLKMAQDGRTQGQAQVVNNCYVKISEIPGLGQMDEKLYSDILYTVGNNFYQTRNYEKALNAYLKFAAIPNAEVTYKKFLLPVYFQTAMCYSNMGKNKEAIDYLKKLIDFPGASADYNQLYVSAYYLVGMNAAQANDFEVSNDYFNKFLELAANSPAHQQLISVAYKELGANRMSMLQQEAEKIKKDNPNDQVQKVAEFAKKFPDTETNLLKAIELNAELEDAYMHLGNYYYFCNELEKTIETYQKLVDKFPGSNQASSYKSFLDHRKEEKVKKEAAAAEAEKAKKAPKKSPKK